MIKIGKKTTLTALIFVLVFLGSVAPVYAYRYLVTVTTPISVGDSNTADASTNDTRIDRMTFNWYDQEFGGSAVRTVVDNFPVCDGSGCSKSDTITGVTPAGTWRVEVEFFVLSDSTYYSVGSATAYFTVTAVPDFPLGVLPLAAVAIVVAAYVRRDRLTPHLS